MQTGMNAQVIPMPAMTQRSMRPKCTLATSAFHTITRTTTWHRAYTRTVVTVSMGLRGVAKPKEGARLYARAQVTPRLKTIARV